MTNLVKDSIREIIYESLAKTFPSNHDLNDRSFQKQIEVSRSKDARFGDYATNVALILAKVHGLKPRDLAQTIAGNMNPDDSFVSGVEIAGPGFINFKMSPEFWRSVIIKVHERRKLFGHEEPSNKPVALIEFVSANPTGPLHVGHGRGAAVGDTLARLLRTRGHRVETEYYVNDAGNQMKILGRSLLLRYLEMAGREIEFPADHYQGDYIKELARQIEGTPLGEKLKDLPEEEALPLASE